LAESCSLVSLPGLADSWFVDLPAGVG